MSKKAHLHSQGEERSVPDLILKILEVGGMLAVGFVAPNAVQLFDLAGNKRQFPRRQFRTALKRLEKRGYIRCQGDRTSWNYCLTKEGKEILKRTKVEDIAIHPPQKWDGKWRLVIFDIPEKYKRSRDALRGKLDQLGFQYLNLSVWIHPFECRNEINAIVNYYDIGEYVRYAIVESFDGMEEMKKQFTPLRRG